MAEFSSISELFPKTLDDIIRAHRDEYSLRLASDEELAALQPMLELVDKHQHIRATVNEWQIICLVGPRANSLMLIGTNASTGRPWITSKIRSVDLKNNIVLTENSLYKLGSKGEGEPDRYILVHICATFHRWGFGASLGVLHVFY